MQHLNTLCTTVESVIMTIQCLKLIGLHSQTLYKTMCEDTVFWDLNYAMTFKELGTSAIMHKVLAVRQDRV